MKSEQKQELTLQEMKNIEVRILEYIHEICEENDLVYYLYAGTLLGAVRHKGFIPWDDDLDIIVPRKDYEKLIKILKDKKEFRLLSYEYVEDYYYPFAKLVDPSTKLIETGIKECSGMGVWVDIFPLDTTSDIPIIRNLHVKLVKKLVGLNRYLAAESSSVESQLNTVGKRLRYSFAKLFRSHTIIRLANNLAGTLRNTDSRTVVNMIWLPLNLFFRSEWFGKPLLLQFEGREFYAPSNYDELLRCCYGDYMQLPPEDQRYSEHFYSCWRI